MELNELGRLLKKTAPFLGMALQGRYASAVWGLLQTVLGQELTPADVAAKAMNEQDFRHQLRVIEHQHAERLREIQLQELKETLSTEREFARLQNQVMLKELPSESVFKSGWRPALGWLVVLWFLVVTVAFLGVIFGFSDVSSSEAAVLITAVGGLMSLVMTILGIRSIKSRDLSKHMDRAFSASPESTPFPNFPEVELRLNK